ncbi:hypothetical protein [Acidisphaera sp. S103]|uniref:hypothetical protein n=1 Tax=Acidisphaera sp. S103 TaxID=1747223 RepID=UPI00131CA983|nr:hypothetical protein [Acidisphaera sp. S103]
MTISENANHPAPTPSRPCQYTLFFIPRGMVAEAESFFAGMEEPDDYFLLVPAMRVEQLSWRPERIKRSDVRSLTHHRAGVWVALSEPQKAVQLRAILDERHRH